MQQNAQVLRDLGDGCAEVVVMRKSACSGDCHQCSGCAAVTQKVTVKAKNLIGAQAGDRVVVESDTKSVLASVFVVYLPPMVLFFAAYFIGMSLGFLPGLLGAAGFLVGLIPAIMREKILRKRQTEFRITQFVQV